MSDSEAVELARASVEAFNRGDLTGCSQGARPGPKRNRVSAEANKVFTLEPDGRVSRVAMYQELKEALAAAVD